VDRHNRSACARKKGRKQGKIRSRSRNKPEDGSILHASLQVTKAQGSRKGGSGEKTLTRSRTTSSGQRKTGLVQFAGHFYHRSSRRKRTSGSVEKVRRKYEEGKGKRYESDLFHTVETKRRKKGRKTRTPPAPVSKRSGQCDS